ncbi:MAG TPA: F0F1 ATP synthase subunit A [Planctomycetes bacterium]|nr:F0F1 ATP synthase subunit A [Planctomycetota bacterium]HIJ70879.1 F0F1 ATP synthase subunit A [Planctomycetota bacterium]
MLDTGGIVLTQFNPLREVVSRELFTVWGITVSNHMFMVTLAAAILLIALPLAVRGKGLVSRGFGNLIETVCVFIREEMARPFLGEATDRHIGFVWTVFFFVLTLNLLGMVPLDKFITLISGAESHLGGIATANIWVTGSLALVAFFSIHIFGMRQQGVWGYVRNFAPNVPWPMVPFIYFLEVVGAIVKPFALAIRLFANMLAGHVVLGTLLGLIFLFKNYFVGAATVIGVVLMSLLELFVAFLQAYIFTFLTIIFIGFAVKPQH